MSRMLSTVHFPLLIVPCLACLLMFSSTESAFAHPILQVEEDFPIQQPVGNDNANAGDAGGEDGDGEIDAVEPTRLDFEIPDRRNQGFVGATAPGIDDTATDTQGFVGPLTGEPDGENAEGRFQGGDTNSGIGSRTPATSGAQLQENGFTVERRGIRTRLRPAFASPKLPGYVVERRFQSRMTRQPVVRRFGQGVTVTIGNKTAVLTGVVSSNAERDIIKRQLRLEPGVYKIEDRTTNAQ